MNRVMKTVLMAFSAFVGGSAFAAATLTGNSWQSDGTGYDGAFTSPGHWQMGLPTAGQAASFNQDASYEVTFPAPAVTNRAALRAYGSEGNVTVFNGVGSRYVIAGAEDGTTEIFDANPIQIEAKPGFGLLKLSIGDTALYSHALAEFNDFRLSIFGSAAAPQLTFDGGIYDFREPAGSTWETVKKPILLLGQGRVTESHEIVFRNGASLRAWNVGVQAAAPTNRLVFNGGSHYTETFAMPEATLDYHWALTNRSDLIVTNCAVLSTGLFKLNTCPNKDTRILVSGPGSRLEARGGLQASMPDGMSSLTLLDGARADILGEATFTSTRGTNYLVSVDSTLNFGAKAQFGDNTTYTLANVRMTNSAVSCAGMLLVDRGCDIRSVDTDWTISTLTMGSKLGRGWSRFEIDGGTTVLDLDATIGSSDSAELVVKSGTVTAYRYVNVGGYTTSTGVLTVAGGKFDNSCTEAESKSTNPKAGSVYLASANLGGLGVLNVTGGEMLLYTLFGGRYGHCAVNVSGGVLKFRGSMRFACWTGADPSGTEDVFAVTGGAVECNFAGIAKVGEASPRTVRLKLHGGTFRCAALQGGTAAKVNGGTGTVVLDADGGTLVASDDSASQAVFLSKFDQALLGEGGLTLDTRGLSIVLNQDLAGTGPLVLVGGGRVTFTAGMSCGVPVIVKNGTTVVFNGVSPHGLTLGQGETSGRVRLTPGETVAVTGDLTINDISFEMNGMPVKGETYPPFITCTGAFPTSSQDTWEDSLLTNVISETESTVFSVSVEAGVTKLWIAQTDKVHKLIEVDGPGESNITWEVSSGTTENQEIAVSDGAVCKISGKIAKGRLIKTGDGRLELSNAENLFRGGFDLGGGLLSIRELGAFGDGASEVASVFRGGTLEIEAEASPLALSNPVTILTEPPTNAVIFKTEGDLSMPMPFGSSCGAIFKRGAGRLKFICDWEGLLSTSYSWGSVGNVVDYTFPMDTPLVAFDDEQGAVPEGAIYGAVNVVEGELVFRGTGANTKINFLSNPIFVGYPTADHAMNAVQPTLTFDNVYASFSGGGTSFRVGDGCRTDNSWVTEPKVVVTNGATLYLRNPLLTGSYSDNSACTPKLILDGSTVIAYYRFTPHHSYSAGVCPKVEVRNGSQFLTQYFELRKPFEMTVDGSVVAAGEPTAGVYPLTELEHFEDHTNTFSFTDGSVFYCNSVKRYTTNPETKPLVMSFDDAAWVPAYTNFTFGFGNVNLLLKSKGRGLVFAPPAGITWTMARELEGEGGFVKRGAGTVVFDSAYAAYQGVTEVADGTLDLAASASSGKFTGSGTLANGVLAGATLKVDADNNWQAGETLTLSDVSVNGQLRIDLGRTEEDPLTENKSLNVVVAKFTGTAPDASQIRLVGTGMRNVRGTFEVRANGEVVLTSCSTCGMIFSVR